MLGLSLSLNLLDFELGALWAYNAYTLLRFLLSSSPEISRTISFGKSNS